MTVQTAQDRCSAGLFISCQWAGRLVASMSLQVQIQVTVLEMNRTGQHAETTNRRRRRGLGSSGARSQARPGPLAPGLRSLAGEKPQASPGPTRSRVRCIIGAQRAHHCQWQPQPQAASEPDANLRCHALPGSASQPTLKSLDASSWRGNGESPRVHQRIGTSALQVAL
jgi:hypothetical protein